MTMRASRPAASSRSSIRRTPKSLVVRRKAQGPETGSAAVGLHPGDLSPEQPRAELRLGRTPHGPGAARSGRERPKRVRGAVEDPGLLNGEGGKRGGGHLPLAEALSRRDPEPLEPGAARRAMREDGGEAVVECDRRDCARGVQGPLDGTRVRIEERRSCFPRRPRGGLPPPRERRRSRGSRGRPRSTPRSRARRRGSRRSRREARADPRSRSRPGRRAPGSRSPRWPGATRRRRARTRAPASRLRRAWKPEHEAAPVAKVRFPPSCGRIVTAAQSGRAVTTAARLSAARPARGRRPPGAGTPRSRRVARPRSVSFPYSWFGSNRVKRASEKRSPPAR